MRCEEIERVLIDYLDNTLDEKTRDEVDRHILTCEKCLDSFNESQKVIRMMSESPESMPEETLRANFYHMLDREIKKSEENHPAHPFRQESRLSRRIFLAAASVALLLAGTFLGMMISGMRNNTGIDKIEMLQAEVDEMKKNAMFAMLREESSSYRLQGVSYAEELVYKDDKIIETLFNILNTDKNTNVRMAAAFSLSKFTSDRMVCDSLVASLPRQSEPILQITLINILVEIKEKSALRPIRQIINNPKTIQQVRNVAEEGAKELAL